jgi:uncharacterized membrane protein YfcA
MELEFYILLLIAASAFIASYTQNLTGFGFGIIAMIFFPSLLVYTEANILSTILGALTSVLVVIMLYRRINWKNLIFPLMGSLIFNYISVTFMKNVKNDTLVLLLGIALFALSVYFFFFTSKIKIRPTWYAGLIAGSLSGVMAGLFSIGGPPVVIYYMQSEKDTDNYLATVSAYFVFSGVIGVSIKAASGFMTPNVWAALVFGMLGMVIGAFFGRLTRSKIKPSTIKKSVYAVMALSGLINIITVLV